MRFSFDLISDLHIETWPEFDWTGQATSPYCIIAGDITRDRHLLCKTLEHLAGCYQGIFYIDGNDEHRWHLEDLGSSYRDLAKELNHIQKVVYLQDNVVIINGVAILATNGWWSYDLDPDLDYEQSVSWLQDRYKISSPAADAITGVAFNDASYIINSIKRLQTHQEVRAIVLVTHTVPADWIVDHDPDLKHHWRFNTMGNRHMQMALESDTEKKIKVWAFGHYHKPVDRIKSNIRYVNNCRGRGDTPWMQHVYYPKRITIEY